MFKRLKELKKEYSNLYFVFGYTLSKFNKGEFQKTYEAVKLEIPDIRYNDFHINLAQISSNYYGNYQRRHKGEQHRGSRRTGINTQEQGIRVWRNTDDRDRIQRKLVEYAKTGKPR